MIRSIQGQDEAGGEEEENVPAEAERLSGLWRNGGKN